MNIFVLDTNPKLAAKYHCDKHVVKMIVETCQMLSTSCDCHNYHKDWMYKPCFQKHPCTLWVNESKENFRWLCNLGLHLCFEYEKRYNKNHKCKKMILKFLYVLNSEQIKWTKTELTLFAKAMPDYIKNEIEDTVLAYRQYYIKEKQNIAVWKYSETPKWYNV
jgi:hypothetical protein